MSRAEFFNKEWMVAFGADHVCGSWVQIWEQPHDEQDTPLVDINNSGVNVYGDTQKLPEMARKYLDGVVARYEYARLGGNMYPNIDADTISTLLAKVGFPGMSKDVYRVLD